MILIVNPYTNNSNNDNDNHINTNNNNSKTGAQDAHPEGDGDFLAVDVVERLSHWLKLRGRSTNQRKAKCS